MNRELNELIADLKDRSKFGATKGITQVYAMVAEELECILQRHGVFEELYECGCPVDEFGCQGFHGC